ncbi:putative ABC-type ATPase [Prosthecobacter fusiformis]|uniref:Putative ABC-type ATPase n=1 Tax=Prosthecobacter fusiformis TaxID=48464 RepID=A0A4V3FI94_9BACT|nr:AAA family ATPase [Prosthecobacter fusiformis]TDU81593.1 putative ABC-type ATPase [Prosthecobacter fusiformis]
MNPPILCIIGGCNGAGKTTFSRELLPALGVKRFLNADEIAKGLSPLDPTLVAFKAGRLLLEEVEVLLAARSSFAIESTLSGRTYVSLIRRAKELGYHFILHYLTIHSPAQAIQRVRLRVGLGGHHVPDGDVERRFSRSHRHFIADYLPLADEWHLWNNTQPPSVEIANSLQDSPETARQWFNEIHLMETPPRTILEPTRIALEAHQRATAKMVDFYKRMGIKVTPEMTLAPERKPRTRKAAPVRK